MDTKTRSHRLVQSHVEAKLKGVPGHRPSADRADALLARGGAHLALVDGDAAYAHAHVPVVTLAEFAPTMDDLERSVARHALEPPESEAAPP